MVRNETPVLSLKAGFNGLLPRVVSVPLIDPRHASQAMQGNREKGRVFAVGIVCMLLDRVKRQVKAARRTPSPNQAQTIDRPRAKKKVDRRDETADIHDDRLADEEPGWISQQVSQLWTLGEDELKMCHEPGFKTP